MIEPEALLLRVLGPMQLCITFFKPVVWFDGRLTDALIRLLGLPDKRDEQITSDDILAMTEAGARAGVLAEREQQAIANIFELDTRTVASAMTQRDSVAYFLRDDPDQVIRARIAEEPFSTYPVCDGDIDHIVGYVDAKDLFQRVLNNQPISLQRRQPDPQNLDGAGTADAGRSARPVPASPRRLCRHPERIQPGGRRGDAERRDEYGDGRSGIARR